MKEQKKIPTGKVERAGKVIGTSFKVGGNYASYYANKLVGKDTTTELNEKNAKDIMKTLSQLKGSALKVAQIMSMDSGLLPTAYQKEFAKAQNQATPLSYPLIKKTFKADIGQNPKDIFTFFNKEATNAASIGQVHEAEYKGRKIAVKIQYPGVADAISSDLKMIKPLARQLMNIPKGGMDHYLEEVERKLLEEANYHLELEQSLAMKDACKHLPGLFFAEYYPEISGNKVLCMSWIDGLSLNDYIATQPNQEERNVLGQWLWDMYVYQIHELKSLHADPHPGNFIITPDKKLAVIDFGCVKKLPQEFYEQYFNMVKYHQQNDTQSLYQVMDHLEFYMEGDSEKERNKITNSFLPLLDLLLIPFEQDHFDFSKNEYFEALANYGLQLSSDQEIKKMNAARGSKHFIYMNRSLFGLFNILHLLGCNNIKTAGMIKD